MKDKIRIKCMVCGRSELYGANEIVKGKLTCLWCDAVLNIDGKPAT